MKRFFILTSLFVCAITASAQLNVQFHYDMGSAIYSDNLSERPQWTATIENFTPDKWGSTYFFIDANFANNTVPSVYGEISRELRFWKAPVAVHLEYNGGTGLKNAFLAGAAYNWANSNFSKTFSVQALYRYDVKAPSPHNWQLTAVWGIHFAKGLCTFSGYADLARNTSLKGDLSFSSEPQFWFNFAPLDWVDDKCKISVGAEVEISNYLADFGKFYAIPTLAAKWTF